MLPNKLQDPFYDPYYQVQSRTYLYYSRYPALKPTKSHHKWRTILRHMGMYMRLVMVGAIMLIVGGIFPLYLSYELFFKEIAFNACQSCIIVGASPSFTNDLFGASILAIFGFMMPILVLYIFIKVMRSRLMRHELFH
jgi:hypothetical protein